MKIDFLSCMTTPVNYRQEHRCSRERLINFIEPTRVLCDSLLYDFSSVLWSKSGDGWGKTPADVAFEKLTNVKI